jgi:hypothetical protein
MEPICRDYPTFRYLHWVTFAASFELCVHDELARQLVSRPRGITPEFELAYVTRWQGQLFGQIHFASHMMSQGGHARPNTELPCSQALPKYSSVKIVP